MDQEKLTDEFIENLQGLNTCLDKLSRLLIKEENALADQKIAEIENIAVEKDQLTAEVEQAEQIRQAHCAQLQISPDKKGILLWLGDKPVSTKKQIAELWKRITYLGQKCNNQNQINGILVAHLQRHTQDALSILRGAVTGQESYSEKGAPENKQQQNIIAKA
ncbi:MAG: flagellar protein FlgN [Thioalkalispiraceae bacterium]|jgi:flagellar biosynthesis/type III secretory pathway chaperone